MNNNDDWRKDFDPIDTTKLKGNYWLKWQNLKYNIRKKILRKK